MKSKTIAEFIEKRTSIAAVRDKLGQIDTFSTPLLSHCGLPLSKDIFWWQGGWPALCEVFPVEEDVESRVWHTLVHLGVGLGLLALYLLYRK
jgi:hypothetical protein